MFYAKNYSDKLPRAIKKPLEDFARNNCVLVKKNTIDFGIDNTALNCHQNVNKYVEKLGGQIINGWLLYRNKQFLNMGIWIWRFHSVWLNKENELIDVTYDPQYASNSFTTFLLDSERKVDLKEGIAFNNIVIFENQSFASFYGEKLGLDIKSNIVYWTDESISRFKLLSEHSGQYRWLFDEYPINSKLLKDSYGVEIIDNKLIAQNDSNLVDSSNIIFDFSLGRAA